MLLLTIGTTYVFHQNARSKDHVRFQSEVNSVKNRIQTLIGNYISSIKAGRSFIQTTENLNRAKFASFVGNLDLAKNYSGIKGLGYSKRIKASEKENFIKQMSNEGYENFTLFPDSQAPELQVIVYLEPLDESNRRALGFDMSSENTRREALERARDTGEAAATGKVILVQDQLTEQDKQPGFLIYLPVYKGGSVPSTIEERRAQLEGFIYSPFRAGNFLSDVQNSISVTDVAFIIYEDSIQPENILASTHNDKIDQKPDFESYEQVDVAGKKWVIEAKTLPDFKSESNTSWTVLICLSGLVLSFLLFGMTYLETNARVKAEFMMNNLRDSEVEKAFLLESEQLERKRAEQANKAKDEFLSIVSHELRTPLNAIAGWSKILGSENLSEPIKNQALEKIDKNLRVQTGIVEELLDFSAIISDKEILNRREVDISKLFEEACLKAEKLANQKGISLTKENSLDGQKLIGDAVRLDKAINNILANAVKFTPKGGKVFAGATMIGNEIELIIRDTGHGITKDELPHIFEHFKQADTSMTRKHGGLGIGLSISNHIIRLHGGSVVAQSDGIEKGAQFTVRLPYDYI